MARNLVVCAIVLLTISAVFYFVHTASERRKAEQLSACCARLRAIATSLDVYVGNSKGGYPPAALSALVPDWIETLPMCPTCDKPYGYERYLDPKTDALTYVVYCPGRHQGLAPGFPRLDGSYGLELVEPKPERERSPFPLEIAPTFIPSGPYSDKGFRPKENPP